MCLENLLNSKTGHDFLDHPVSTVCTTHEDVSESRG